MKASRKKTSKRRLEPNVIDALDRNKALKETLLLETRWYRPYILGLSWSKEVFFTKK